MGGVDMAYESGALRDGGAQAGGAGETAAGAAVVLRGATCPAASLGLVAGAQELAAAFVRARDAHVTTSEQVTAHHTALEARAGQTAGTGDGLTSATERTAAGG